MAADISSHDMEIATLREERAAFKQRCVDLESRLAASELRRDREEENRVAAEQRLQQFEQHLVPHKPKLRIPDVPLAPAELGNLGDGSYCRRCMELQTLLDGAAARYDSMIRDVASANWYEGLKLGQQGLATPPPTSIRRAATKHVLKGLQGSDANMCMTLAGTALRLSSEQDAGNLVQ